MSFLGGEPVKAFLPNKMPSFFQVMTVPSGYGTLTAKHVCKRSHHTARSLKSQSTMWHSTHQSHTSRVQVPMLWLKCLYDNTTLPSRAIRQRASYRLVLRLAQPPTDSRNQAWLVEKVIEGVQACSFRSLALCRISLDKLARQHWH